VSLNVSLEVLGDRVGALLDSGELKVNLHDTCTSLGSKHGEERVPESSSRGTSNNMDDVGLGQCRNKNA